MTGRKSKRDLLLETIIRKSGEPLTSPQRNELTRKLLETLSEVGSLDASILTPIANKLVNAGWRKLDLDHPSSTNQSASTSAEKKWAQPLRVKSEDLIFFIHWLAKDDDSIDRLRRWLISKASISLGVTQVRIAREESTTENSVNSLLEAMTQVGSLDQLFTFTNSLWTMWPRHATAEIYLGYHDIVNDQLNDRLTSFNDSEGASAIMAYLHEQSVFGVKTRIRLNSPVDKVSKKTQKPLLKHQIGATISIGTPNANGKTLPLATQIWEAVESKNIRKPYLVLKERPINKHLPTDIGFFRKGDNSSFRLGSNAPMSANFEMTSGSSSDLKSDFRDYGLVLVDARDAFESWHRNKGMLNAVVAGIGFHATRASCNAFGYVMDVLAQDLTNDPRIILTDGIALAAIEVTDPQKIENLDGPNAIWKLSDHKKVDEWSENQGWNFIDLSGEKYGNNVSN